MCLSLFDQIIQVLQKSLRGDVNNTDGAAVSENAHLDTKHTDDGLIREGLKKPVHGH